MKKLITLTALFMLVAVISTDAQRGRTHHDRQNDRGYGDHYGDYHNDQYNDRWHERTRKLSRRDRKRLKRLHRELVHFKGHAWADGYLSRRERRQIRRMERKIEDILPYRRYYNRNNYSYSYHYGGNSCR